MLIICFLIQSRNKKHITFDLQLLHQNQSIMQIHNSGHHNSNGSDRFKFCIMYKITPFAFKKSSNLFHRKSIQFTSYQTDF